MGIVAEGMRRLAVETNDLGLDAGNSMNLYALCAAERDGCDLTGPDPFRPSHLQQHTMQVRATV